MTHNQPTSSLIERITRFCIEKKVVVFLVIFLVAGWGVLVSPFDWTLGGGLRDPVPVDAIPDIGENQQIVFTEWSGRSPQDVEDQITYPLTVSLLGIPGVKSIRSFSMFGFSSIYVIFKDAVDFYWSRSRILEKLASLPRGSLPEDVQPVIGPDATSMGQVFWYTLEGLDADGFPAGEWDLNELRTIQDWYVRFALLSVPGVSEVGSVGGFVQEYQVDLDPDLMRINNVTLNEVVAAVKGTNLDVGAQTIEVNRVEYLIRGMGFVKGLEDLETALVKLNDGVPIFLDTIAKVSLGPAARQGALDKGGAETVGGVVVVRYGENPLKVIQDVKRKIVEITPGLPKRELHDGTVSQVRIVPFYDRTDLIHETLNTLQTALTNEILVTIVVIIAMLFHLRCSILVSGLLPLAVLMCFIGMKLSGVDANIVALSGIAIAIGTMVDMGIILTENILRHMEDAPAEADRGEIILKATREVGGAVLTAVATTIVSFLPVFTMEGAEGKLFRPLAFTKTYALIAALIVAIGFIPPLAHILFSKKLLLRTRRSWVLYEALVYLGAVVGFLVDWRLGILISAIGGYHLILRRLPDRTATRVRQIGTFLVVLLATVMLAQYWMPLGIDRGTAQNVVFVAVILGGVIGALKLFLYYYRTVLAWCLDHKTAFMAFPLAILLMGALVWQGFGTLFDWLPRLLKDSPALEYAASRFPGLGKEFMPPMDEGSFLFMPTTMPHASIGEMLDVLQKQDAAIQAVPEVELAVGKIGRTDSPLDPAPLSMIETLITYKPQYLHDADGELLRFRFSAGENDYFRNAAGEPLPAIDGKPYMVRGKFERDADNKLIPDPRGKPFRLWRSAVEPDLNPGRKIWKGVQEPDDIWNIIIRAAYMPGTTTAARLQPISARMVMLQSGIRARMGIRVTGPDLETIQSVSLRVEEYLREVPSISPATVVADRIIGKPYLEIHIDRQAIAQYGIGLQQVLDVIEFAIGGKRLTTTVEGRERYPVRVRYARELRDSIETIGGVLVPAANGTQIPLMQLADIIYVRGPQAIKGENTFLVGYVLFDRLPGHAEVDVVDAARTHLATKIDNGEFVLPANVSYSFIGTYENQLRAEKRLTVILPVALVIIFIILYLQFNSLATSSLVFSGIAVAWSGGFIMIWLYSQPWFLDFSLFGVPMRDLFQVHSINLSVAIWVGFLALFGIATDDGVVMATYLEDSFAKRRPDSVEGIRQATIAASLRRVRPCLMTTATTILALIPVLTSRGRGADIMVPMAIPVFGGMVFEVITMLVVPVLYCWIKEFRFEKS